MSQVSCVSGLETLNKALLVAGYHEQCVAEDEYEPNGFAKRFGFMSGNLKHAHFQTHARHAGDQARWTAEMVRELRLESLSLYIPSFHIIRGYLTLLRALQRVRVQIPIIPVPSSTPPNRGFLMPPDSGATTGEYIDQWRLVSGELPRIKSYQTRDDPPPDCITFPELRNYLAWLWNQPIMKVERIV